MRSKRIISAAAGLMMLFGAAQGPALSAFADDGSYEEKADALGRYFARVILDSDFSYTVDDPEISFSAPEQRKFDLRDVDGKNFVTPVKNQRKTGNCWAFTTAACIETSILCELGIDLNECDESDVPDFSERQFAWFAAVPLGENSLYPSQTGEGSVRYASYLEMQKDDPDHKIVFKDVFGGGYNEYILSMLSTRQGPIDEKLVPNLDELYMTGSVIIYDVINDPAQCESMEELTDVTEPENVPYHSKEEFLGLISDESLKGFLPDGWKSDPDWYKGNGKYWRNNEDRDASLLMDWSVDDAYRFSDYTVENICFSERLAGKDPETGGYVLNESVLNFIKSEIASGRPVFVPINYGSSDQNNPMRFVNYIDSNGEKTSDPDLADCVCSYAFDTGYYPDDPESVNRVVSVNHAVTAIGYDDDFPKEYFNDPKGNIKGNGAFIMKNSWGSKDSYDPFGNNGDGFFYVSYYDQSVRSAVTVDFKLSKPGVSGEEKLSFSFEHLYDVMTAPWYEECIYDDASYSNVFHCDNDQKLVSVATLCGHPNNRIKYDVYILNDGYTSPTDGVLVSSKTVKEKMAGYHNVDLDEPLYLKKGTSFSVVVTAEREDGTKTILFKNDINEKKGLESYEDDRDKYIAVHGTDEGFVPYNTWFSRAVVNKGESFVYSDGDWFDWSDIVDVMHTCGVDPDSSITSPAELTDFDNFSIHAYTESAYFSTDHRIAEPQDKPYNVGDEVRCSVLLTKALDGIPGECEVFVNGRLIGTAGQPAAGETVELAYTYTVADEDLERGFFENTVQVFAKGADGSYRELELLDPINRTAVKADVAEQDDESESEPDESSESEPDDTAESKPDDSSSSEPDDSAESEPDDSSSSEPDSSEKPSGKDDTNPKTGAEAAAVILIAASAAVMTIAKRKRR